MTEKKPITDVNALLEAMEDPEFAAAYQCEKELAELHAQLTQEKRGHDAIAAQQARKLTEFRTQLAEANDQLNKSIEVIHDLESKLTESNEQMAGAKTACCETWRINHAKIGEENSTLQRRVRELEEQVWAFGFYCPKHGNMGVTIELARAVTTKKTCLICEGSNEQRETLLRRVNMNPARSDGEGG